MADLGRHDWLAQSVVAGETLELEFNDLGSYMMATCLVKAVLGTGAALTISVEARPDDDVADWFGLRFVDLAGASASTLVASIALADSATRALLAIIHPVGPIRVTIENTAEPETEDAEATLDVWLVTSG